MNIDQLDNLKSRSCWTKTCLETIHIEHCDVHLTRAEDYWSWYVTYALIILVIVVTTAAPVMQSVASFLFANFYRRYCMCWLLLCCNSLLTQIRKGVAWIWGDYFELFLLSQGGNEYCITNKTELLPMQNMAIIYNFCLHSGKKIVLMRTIIVIRCVTMM